MGCLPDGILRPTGIKHGVLSSISMREPKFFLRSVAILLFFSAIAKLVALFGNSEVLKFSDPVLLVSHRIVFLGASVLELLLAFFCLYAKDFQIALYFILTLGICFGLYHFGMHVLQVTRDCSCFGDTTALLHISSDTARQ
jgi:disulfide bond formation protein DsbB